MSYKRSEISNCNKERLSAIEQSARLQAAEIQILRSQAAATRQPVLRMENQLSALQTHVNLAVDSVASHSGSMVSSFHELSHAVQTDIRRSKEVVQSQLFQQQEKLRSLEKLLEGLQSHGGQIKATPFLYHRIAGKQAALQAFRDAKLPIQFKRQRVSHAEASSRSWNGHRVISEALGYNTLTGGLCSCHRLRRTTTRKEVHLGHVRLAAELETQGHWANCPLSNSLEKRRFTIGLRYTGFTGILKSVIDFSLISTFGTGGYSIGPNLACYPTVDFESDPGALVISLMGQSSYFSQAQDADLFMKACLKRLITLIENNRMCPSAVDGRNRSFMHHAAMVVSFPSFSSVEVRLTVIL